MAEVNILIVDDDPLFATETGIMLQDLGYSKVKTIRSADAKLNLIESHTPDLILFSLYSATKAADLVRAARLKEAFIPTIFLAEQNDQESFDQARSLEPYGFLFRPFDKLNLQSTIEVALFHNRRRHLTKQLVQGWRDGAMPSDVLFVKSNNKLFRVRLLDIVVIEAEGNYSILNTTQKKYAVKTSLKQLKRKLSPQLFAQIHRNYIVQIPHVDSIDITSGEVHLNNRNYPIGGKFKNEFIRKLNQL
ncbi:MAG: response regulator transcription factor [Saprospiraceae bacterium]|nr:response regulator transcription factor [Saprospiraceae bacterium]